MLKPATLRAYIAILYRLLGSGYNFDLLPRHRTLFFVAMVRQQIEGLGGQANLVFERVICPVTSVGGYQTERGPTKKPVIRLPRPGNVLCGGGRFRCFPSTVASRDRGRCVKMGEPKAARAEAKMRRKCREQKIKMQSTLVFGLSLPWSSLHNNFRVGAVKKKKRKEKRKPTSRESGATACPVF